MSSSSRSLPVRGRESSTAYSSPNWGSQPLTADPEVIRIDNRGEKIHHRPPQGVFVVPAAAIEWGLARRCAESAAARKLHPILGPVAPARRAAHGTSRKVVGGRRMEPSGSGSASLSLGPLRARPSGRLLSRRSAQQGKRARRRGALRQLYGLLRQAPLHAR